MSALTMCQHFNKVSCMKCLDLKTPMQQMNLEKGEEYMKLTTTEKRNFKID